MQASKRFLTFAVPLSLLMLGHNPGKDAGSAFTCERRVDQAGIDSPVPAHTTGHSAVFQIVNIGTAYDTAGVTCNGIFTVSCTGVEPSSVGMEPGDSVEVTATFDAGDTGTGYVFVLSCGIGNKQRVIVQ